MNSDFLKAVLFVLLLDLVFFFAQIGVDSVAADVGTNTSIFNYNGSLINSADAGNYTLNNDVSSDIPSGSNSVDSQGGTYTDIWKTLRSWSMTFISIVNAVPRFIIFMGAPPEIVFALGAIWHIFSITIIVLFLKGGGG